MVIVHHRARAGVANAIDAHDRAHRVTVLFGFHAHRGAHRVPILFGLEALAGIELQATGQHEQPHERDSQFFRLHTHGYACLGAQLETQGPERRHETGRCLPSNDAPPHAVVPSSYLRIGARLAACTAHKTSPGERLGASRRVGSPAVRAGVASQSGAADRRI